MQWFLTSTNSNTVKYVRDSTGQAYYSQESATSTGQYKVHNIYDMAGNCYEWSLEVSGTDGRTLRRRRLYYRYWL